MALAVTRLDGRVEASYVGPVRQATVDAEALGPLFFTLPGHTPVEPGERASVSWPESAAWLVPARDRGELPAESGLK